MKQGKIVEYIDHGKFICTICLQDNINSLRLLTPSNREVKLPPKRAILVSEKSINTEKSREELVEILKQTEQTRIKLMEGIDVKELWELVRDENEHFENKYLAQLVFGLELFDDHFSAVVRKLFEDHLYFKMKDNRFLANSEEKVELIIKQREEEALREERLNHGSAWLRDIHDGKQVKDPLHKEYIVNLLIQLALYGKDTPDAKYGKELLAKAGISDIQKARELLINLGVWEEDENLDLLREGVETSFNENQLEESARLAGAVTNSDCREDLRDLFVITVDGPFTQDFDDAVSLELVDDEVHIGVHIADVAEVILPGSILDNEASKRGTTLYLPRKQISMIPQDLSHDTLSLVQGCDRPAVSLLVNFDKRGKLLDYRFTASIIKVHQKLTYEQVDKILDVENPPFDLNLPQQEKLSQMLTEMYQISRRLYQERIAHDALRLSLPELYVSFNDNSSFSLGQDDQDTPSRIIIAELMILYNNLAARFCRDNELPALFRTQSEPSERLSEDEASYIYYVFKQRRKLSPVQIVTTAGPHSGLGLDAYVQVTSPIRRYMDLLVQRQIRRYLFKKDPVYSVKELENIRIYVEPVIKKFMLIKRNRIRYWTLKYLSLQRGKKYKAVVLDELKKYRIVLCDFFLIAEINRREGVIMSPGNEIEVEVRYADPWEDIIKLEYAE